MKKIIFIAIVFAACNSCKKIPVYYYSSGDHFRIKKDGSWDWMVNVYGDTIRDPRAALDTLKSKSFINRTINKNQP